jgi:hypothetical protein
MEKIWYLAELIEQIEVEGYDNIRLWVNCILVHAVDAEEAYQKALQFGDAKNSEHLNSEGERVTHAFRGLRGLYEIYEELEDGAEIIYEDYEDIARERIDKMIKKKEELAVFQPHIPRYDV